MVGGRGVVVVAVSVSGVVIGVEEGVEDAGVEEGGAGDSKSRSSSSSA